MHISDDSFVQEVTMGTDGLVHVEPNGSFARMICRIGGIGTFLFLVNWYMLEVCQCIVQLNVVD